MSDKIAALVDIIESMTLVLQNHNNDLITLQNHLKEQADALNTLNQVVFDAALKIDSIEDRLSLIEKSIDRLDEQIVLEALPKLK